MPTPNNASEMIETTLGLMPKAALLQNLGNYENETEHVHYVEYFYGGVLVHRSVHTHLKLGQESTVTGNMFA